MKTSQQIGRIVADILCIGLVFLPWFCLHFAATPFHRGFFCDDESISHPYSESTISTEVLTVVGLALPIIGFLVTEGVHFSSHRKKGLDDPPYMLGDKAIPFLIYQYYKYIGVFLFGAAFQQTIVNIGKYSIGRLRPHFLAVCDPDYSMFNCSNSRGMMVYIEMDGVCRGTDEEKILEMRLSFPSGHASFSAYSAVYLAMYLHARFTWKGSKLLCPLLQCIGIMMALYCCLSRVSDYKHHWSDVLIGAIFGVIIAAICVIHFTDVFHQKKQSEKKKSDTDLPQLVDHIKMTNIDVHPNSRATYLTDHESLPGEPGDSFTNHRHYYSVQP